MDVTAKLVRVFSVDKQLRGLQSRLGSAERFLSEQTKEIEGLDSKRTALESQLKSNAAQAADFEGEMARLDAKMTTIRKQMDEAQTNKEYKAFLTEVNTFKADRDGLETKALELLTKSDDLKKQLSELTGKRSEREQVQKVAAGEREQRFKEIETRLNELKAERAKLASEVPADVMSMFERLISRRGDEAMGPVEVADRKRHEYHCGVCMMALPVDLVSGLMSSGKLTLCKSCQCVLYLDEVAKAALDPSSAKSGKAGKGKSGTKTGAEL
jgi:predicted  nucleic acid-binding Zn-ribbon protein